MENNGIEHKSKVWPLNNKQCAIERFLLSLQAVIKFPSRQHMLLMEKSCDYDLPGRKDSTDQPSHVRWISSTAPRRCWRTWLPQLQLDFDKMSKIIQDRYILLGLTCHKYCWMNIMPYVLLKSQVLEYVLLASPWIACLNSLEISGTLQLWPLYHSKIIRYCNWVKNPFMEWWPHFYHNWLVV